MSACLKIGENFLIQRFVDQKLKFWMILKLQDSKGTGSRVLVYAVTAHLYVTRYVPFAK